VTVPTTPAVVAVACCLLIGGCTGGGSTVQGSAGVGASPGAVPFRGCMVSAVGGFDDRGLSQQSFAAITTAHEEFEIATVTVETGAAAQVGADISSLIAQKCRLVIAIGAAEGPAVQAAAQASPETDFVLVDARPVDANGPVVAKNIKPSLFNSAEPAYLAGYFAAASSTTGKVATFGATQTPSTMLTMDGFADGVAAYNAAKGAAVQLLGWSKDTQTGSFTGDLIDEAKGRALTQTFLDAGADVVMPVAGPVGLGAAAAARAKGGVKVIWTDSDGVKATDYDDVIVASVVKNAQTAVLQVLTDAADGTYDPKPIVGSLTSKGVSFVAPTGAAMPAALEDDLDALGKKITEGQIVLTSPNLTN
jgi:basic membrane protein A